MDIEERLTNLENLVYSLINRDTKDKFYSNANSASQIAQINKNAEQTKIGDSALEDAVCELSETVAELEQVINN